MSEEIILYTSSGWKQCDPVKEFLSQENIDYKAVDVNANPSAVEDLVNLTGQIAVPVVKKGEDFVVGNNIEELKKLIS